MLNSQVTNFLLMFFIEKLCPCIPRHQNGEIEAHLGKGFYKNQLLATLYEIEAVIFKWPTVVYFDQ